jgi:hypothetical protein
MQKRDFKQARRQKELSRKQRQQEKLQRRHGRTSGPAVAEGEAAPVADPAKSGDAT